ncbi:hypothetical protein KO488_04575 [Poseidonibacter lekithochrous]|uniref:hypothetical protein n=1 Tax=Poseidonibacter TaxID=2321187 RepID=UPI001C0916E5|nr:MULTISPECIES: hypothetical protein [Poseidonibacter]MBU3014022.1 hypothetical protein [Poseidonibacter lekithochrous]MDO6827317.1 hypothetical protein [Poseidonibacter sp. 1_MG-2023]
MNIILILVTIIFTLLIIIYVIYSKYQEVLETNKTVIKDAVEGYASRSRALNFSTVMYNQLCAGTYRDLEIKQKENKIDNLQIDLSKLLLFNPKSDFIFSEPATNSNNSDSIMVTLYNIVIVKNLWLEDPFHTNFYNILHILEKNYFRTINPNTQNFTMILRDDKNNTSISDTYQYHRTDDFLTILLNKIIYDILKFKKEDAQKIIIAICFFLITESIHFKLKENVTIFTESVLNDYVDKYNIQKIINLIKNKDEKFSFFDIALKETYFISEKFTSNNNEEIDKINLKLRTYNKSYRSI